jgi:DNA-binding SARP family transcriptional activator
MPDTLRIGLLGPLQVRDETGHAVHVGGRQLRVLLILLALEAGRVVPAGSLAGQIWPEESPANPGNALQTLVSRLRAELRRASLEQVIESHPAGYRLAVRPDAVDALDFQVLAVRGRRALADGDPREAAAVLRSALASWRGQPLADAVGYDFADAAAAQLTELRSSVLTDRIEADLALGEGASLVGELRALLSADPLAERPRALLMRALYAAGRQAEALEVYHQARELLAGRLGVDPSAQLEQVYLRILRGEEGAPAVATGAARPSDQTLDAERSVVPAPGTTPPPVASSPGAGRCPRQPEQAADHDEVVRPGQSLVRGRVLAGEADELADLVCVAQHVVAAHPRLPPVGPQQCGQDPDRGRLAGSVGAEDAEHPALPGDQVDSGERRRLTEPLDQPGGLDRAC